MDNVNVKMIYLIKSLLLYGRADVKDLRLTLVNLDSHDNNIDHTF